MNTTILVNRRRPTVAERKRGAEVAFDREDKNGNRVTVLGAACYESWEQWGAATCVLSENIDAIEDWRRLPRKTRRSIENGETASAVLYRIISGASS